MKISKIIGIIVAALVGIILIVPIFLPTDYHVERYEVMKASADVIYPYLNDLEKMQEWGPWQRHDETIKNTYGDKKEGIGANYSWTSENSGAGSMTITKSTPNKEVKTDLVFEGQGTSLGTYLIEKADEGSKVIWSFDTKFSGLWIWRWFGLGMESSSAPFMTEGLGYLKEIVEAKAENPPAANYTVNVVDYPAQQFVGKREKVSFADITAFYGKHFSAIGGMVGDKMAGMPCGLFFEFNEEAGETDMAAAFPVTEAIEMKEGYELINLPARSALLIDYYGPYEGSVAAHEAMEVYMKENDYTPSELPVIEQYITDPGEEPDPNKWLTKIFYFADKE